MKETILNIGFRWSLIWAATLVLVALLMPDGRWTIDDGVKQIAAEQAKRFPPLVVVDGPARSGLENSGDYAPFAEPFARRVNGGFALGFSPLTRLLFDFWFWGGKWLLKLLPLLIGLVLWYVLAKCGIEYGFLLLPLTFYSLVPWEHATAWLLSWPICWMLLLREREARREELIAAGLALAFAIALRPETLLLAGVLVVYLLFRKRIAQGVTLLTVTGGVTAIFAALFKLAADSPAIQITLNYGSMDFAKWFASLPASAYHLLLSFDRDPGLSMLLIALLIAGALFVHAAERKSSQRLLAFGAAAMGLGFIILQFRIWSAPVPPLALLDAGSLLVALPWVLVLLLPPYRERPVFWLGAAAMLLGILLAPQSQGVHWGPRLLLFAVPLLVIDLYRSKRARGWLFQSLLILTLAQTAGSALLAYGRAVESSEHADRIVPKLGKLVICPTRSQCIDLAPLWTDREFFVTTTTREFRRLLIELREQEIDTVWMHLDAFDPLYIETFPEPKPVWPYRMTIVQAGTVYVTRWRLYELVMNRADSTWGEVLNREAGYLMGEGDWEKARRLEAEAVELMPGNGDIRSNYAVVLAEFGETENAIYQARLAIELNPELREPRLLLNRLGADERTTPEAISPQ